MALQKKLLELAIYYLIYITFSLLILLIQLSRLIHAFIGVERRHRVRWLLANAVRDVEAVLV